MPVEKAMREHTSVDISTTTWELKDMSVSKNDKEILRGLAKRVAELANRPIEQEKRKLWYALNGLRNDRPAVFCEPELAWNEIIKDEDLLCEGDLALVWENTLRKEIFRGESLCDDRVIEPYFNVPYISRNTGWGMYKEIKGSLKHGSYRWDAPLTDYKDFDKLHYPEIVIDHDRTNAVMEQAEEILGDLLSVRLKNVWWWTLGMTWTLVDIRGLEQILYDIHDHPKELHRLMAYLRDGYMYFLDNLEREGLLSLNNDGTYIASGGFGWSDELPSSGFDEKVRCMDIWGFAESQETIGVSPQVFEEFVFQYQLPLLERFGLNCYGCCEPIDKRWHIVKNIPRLRRVSVSPWANIADTADMLEDKYVMSLKPHPRVLATANIDEDSIRKEVREMLRATKNCKVELIMKDTTTIYNNPNNVIKWSKIAMEEAKSL